MKSLSLTAPPSNWIQNRFKKREVFFIDGDEFLIAVPVRNNETGKLYWQIDRVIANCDGENFQLTLPSGESYDDWSWFDVDFYMRLDASGPMTKKQMEKFL